MMKKKRLQLKDLKVRSFLTMDEGEVSQTIKGGLRDPDQINVSPRCGASAATFCPDCDQEQ